MGANAEIGKEVRVKETKKKRRIKRTRNLSIADK